MKTPASVTSSERGFSLSEALVALAVTSMVFLAALSMLAIDNRVYQRDDAVLEVAREARHALETIENDLLMTGFLVDKQTIADVGPDGTADTGDDIVGQTAVVYAAPYEIVVNADLDPAIEAIVDGNTGDALPTGYAPVTFHTGAETIRYTLDSNGDGVINANDRGDEAEEAIVENPGLYLLRREVYGDNGTDNVSGAGPVGLVRGPVAYPNGTKPLPLFLYWGDFHSAAGLELWGDTGAGGGIARNGVLEPGELTALGPVTDEDANDNAVLDAGEDRNGNGMLDRRIGDIIKRAEVHVTSETPYSDMKYADKARSSSTNPFRYRAITLSTEIKPRNIDLPGGACGDQPQPTSSVTVVNACADPLSDGRVRINWSLSADDGGGEMDVEKYILYRTDVDSVFGTTPYSEANKGETEYVDDWIIMRTWPPRQYWYRLRAMDCTPQLSVLDPVGGAYPSQVGGQYPTEIEILDVPGDDGSQLEVVFSRSPDEGANTTGFGGDVNKYYVHRSESLDYRCVPPVNNDAIVATGAASYTYLDNDTNSSSAPVVGTLYYYWMRGQDTSGALSPYSPRYCGRAFAGPTYPIDQEIRVAGYAANDHPVEIYFSENPRNDDAGYDHYLIDYNIYRANDFDADGTLDSLVDHTAGYRLSDRVATVRWTGLVYGVGSGGSGRAYESIDGGTTWRPINTDAGFQPRAIAFGSRVNAIVVGDSGGGFYSTNAGAEWQAAPVGTAADLRGVAFLDESTAIAVGSGGTVIKTTDGGAHWSDLGAALVADLNAVAAAGNFVVVVGNNGIAARSSDGGVNWSLMSFVATDLYSVAVAREGGGDHTILVGTEDQVWRSTDSGVNWTNFDFVGAGRFRGVALVPGGPSMAVVRESDAVYRAVDGVTWVQEAISPSQPISVAMLDANIAWVGDTSGRVYHRSFGGSWSNVLIDGSGSDVRSLAVRPEIAWQDTTTANVASGTPYFYVVTASYAQSSPLDGEAGVLTDRAGTVEIPDDGEDQVLVDSCNSIELAVAIP